MKDQTVVKLDDEDNVAVALGAFGVDVWIDAIGQPLRILTPIPAGHKVATRDIPRGAHIVKYRQTIGVALLRRTLVGYACNPNFAGVLLVGLGCEVNQVNDLVAQY